MIDAKPKNPASTLVITPQLVLSAADLCGIVEGRTTLLESAELIEAIKRMEAQLARLIAEQRPVYGLTTGFGPLVQYANSTNLTPQVQRNLIYHLATGTGDLFSYDEARALLVARLSSLMRGHSGASVQLIRYMIAVLNAPIAPKIPQKGTVGASGDLTPSAHMALALLGEGGWLGADGRDLSAADFKTLTGLDPFEPMGRDCLSMVNGTSCMTGLTALSIAKIDRLKVKALHSSAALVELIGARAEAYSEALSAVRGHKGQVETAAAIRDFLGNSKRLKPFVAKGKIADTDPSFQAPYSLRCLPQIFGAVTDFYDHAKSIVEAELNAVTDNPVIVDEDPYAVHGGNFYGQHTGFGADIMSAMITKISILLDRQIDLASDPNRNGGYAHFLTAGQRGLNSGLMGAQVTASALVAEMRTQSGWASLQSIPTNGHNQDVNTMGTTAARLLRRNLHDFASLIAIHHIMIAELYDRITEREPDPQIHANVVTFVEEIREIVEPLSVDRPLSADIAELSAALLST